MPDDPTAATELADLAAAVRRLRMDWRDPEPYYEQCSEISGALMRLSRTLVMPPPRAIASPTLRMPPRPPVARPAPVVAAPPRRVVVRRHRFPRPPVLPADVQPMLDLA